MFRQTHFAVGTLLILIRLTVTQKNDDILLVQNSSGARLHACAIFFDCEISLHQSPRLVGFGWGNVVVQDGDAKEVLNDKHDGPSGGNDREPNEGGGDAITCFLGLAFITT